MARRKKQVLPTTSYTNQLREGKNRSGLGAAVPQTAYVSTFYDYVALLQNGAPPVSVSPKPDAAPSLTMKSGIKFVRTLILVAAIALGLALVVGIATGKVGSLSIEIHHALPDVEIQINAPLSPKDSPPTPQNRRSNVAPKRSHAAHSKR